MKRAEFSYKGNELDIFQHAVNWKRYWAAQVRPHVGSCVLEVGAGIGANTPYLNKGAKEWVCLEPDAHMAAMLVHRQRENQFPATNVIAGTIAELPPGRKFDSIIYIDVLEHIENDSAEINVAASRLCLGGKLIVLSPAHSWLFSPFDAAIGHFRRYSSRAIRALTPCELKIITLRQLDSIGMFASAASRFILRPQMPTLSQVLFWDRFLVPASRVFDPLLRYWLGKSILVVWQRG
jgi:SAM-dependent methyltransferase